MNHWLLVFILSIISGLGDSQGFYYASKIWDGNKLIWSELGKSTLGFAVGIGSYWIMIRSLNAVGVHSPLLQTMLWFSMTIIGIAVVRKDIFSWQRLDQFVALCVLAGIGWLLVRVEA